MLAAAGVDVVFGAQLSGIGHVPVADPAVAVALADAWGAMTGHVGVAILAGEPVVVHFGSRPGAVVHHPTVVADDDELFERVRTIVYSWQPVTSALALHLDLEAPSRSTPPNTAGTASGSTTFRSPAPDGESLGLEVLERLADPSVSVALVAGPGVVRARRADDLRAAAAAWSVGVINTWGAKGLFAWDDPTHHGTAGLQALDFALGGLTDCELVVGIGTDPAESPRYRWALGAAAVEVDPNDLATLMAATGSVARTRPGRPALYSELAAVLGPHYRGEVPGSPATAVLGAKARISVGEMDTVCARGGPAGLWLARTFPTDRLGSVVVPAVPAAEFPLAAAVAAGCTGRRGLSVVDQLGEAERRWFDEAERRGIRLSVEVWSDQATDDATSWSSSSSHDVRWVTIDSRATDDLVGVAGPVVAWT